MDNKLKPAFPTHNGAPYFGLSKREYFALQAMHSVLQTNFGLLPLSARQIATTSVTIADAMLKELEKS